MGSTARKRDDLKARAKTLQRDLTSRERRRLTERVRLVTVARKRARARIRVWARRRRAEVREKIRATRLTVLERLKKLRARRLALIRERAALLLAKAKRRFSAIQAERLTELRRELADQKLILDRERSQARAHRVTGRERRQESDDDVRSNLDPEYRAIFNRVKKQIRGGPRRTRTEAFLEWLGEHPDEVLAMQAGAAERVVDEMVREQLEKERLQARREKSGVVATWRGRHWRLERAGEEAWVEMRVGRRVVRWTVTERDADWTLGKQTKGKPTAADTSAAAAWVDSLDGWTPLDDLADVPF
jgi:hypothetical protein